MFKRILFSLLFFAYLPLNSAGAQATACSTASGGLCAGYNSAECSIPGTGECSYYPRCAYSGVISGYYCKRNCYNTGQQGSCSSGSVCLCINQSVCALCTANGQNLSQCNDNGCGGSDTQPPAITITSPTANASYTSNVSPMSISGTASDNSTLSSVTWSNSRNSGFQGGSGTANGTSNWTINTVNLETGQNVITVTARDGTGNTSSDTITVTYSPPSTQGYPAITVTDGSSAYSVSISDADTLAEVAYAWGEKPNVYFLLPFANEDTPTLSATENARYNYLTAHLPTDWDILTANRHPMKFYFLPPFRVTAYSRNENSWQSYITKTISQFESTNAGILRYPAIYVFLYPQPYFDSSYINIFGTAEKRKLAEVYIGMFNDTKMTEYSDSGEVMSNLIQHELVHYFAHLPDNSQVPPGNRLLFWISHPAGFAGTQQSCSESTNLVDCKPYGSSQSPTGTEGYYEAYSIISLARWPITKANFGNRDPELSAVVEMAMGVRSKYEDGPFMFYEGTVTGIGNSKRFTLASQRNYNISSRYLYDYSVDPATHYNLYWNLSKDNTRVTLANTTRSFSVQKADQAGRALIVYAGDALNPGYFKVFGNNASSERLGDTTPPASPTGLAVR